MSISYPAQSETSTSASLQVAPFMVLRIAGLDASYVSQLPDDLLTFIHQRIELEAESQRLTPALINQLYGLVSRSEADKVRSEIIRCRRHLYHQREFRLSPALDVWLSQYAPATLTQLQHWRQIVAQQQSLAQFNQIWLGCWQQTLHRLADAAKQPAMRKALSLAAPQLALDLTQPWQSWPAKRQRRVARSLFAYMVRAAGKISPFSTFASCCLLPLNNSAQTAILKTNRWQVVTGVQLNRSLALALRSATYAMQHLAQRNLPLYRNSSLKRVSATQLRGYFYHYEKRRGALWSEEQQALLTLAPEDIDALLAAPARQCWQKWLNHFIGHGFERAQAERHLKMLIRKDVLRPLPQWSAHHPAPLTLMLNQMPTDKVSPMLRGLPELAQQFSEAGIRERIALQQQVHQTIRDTWQGLTSHQMPEIRNLLFEDAWSEGIEMQPAAPFISNVLQRVAKVIGRRASCSADYLWLRRCFINRFGIGGECSEIALFLQQNWDGFVSFSQALLTQPEAAMASLQGDDIRPEALRLPVSVYLQFCANSVDELHHADSKVVINNVYPRIGWQLARTTLSHDSGSEKRATALRRWLQQVAGDALPLTFSVSGESSNLQSQARLAEQHLCLDQEPQEEDDLTLAQLRLRHDPHSGLLQLIDEQNRIRQLFYLGAATPMAAWGIKYLLTVLAEPVQIGRPALNQMMAEEHDDDFRHIERLEEDNCVLIRETWWVRCARLFRELADHPTEAQPARLLELLLKKGLPADSYVNGQYNDYLSWQAFNHDKVRKPVWCRLGNPFCLDHLLMLAKKVDWLVFREVLPQPSQSWMQSENKRYVSETHIEMVISGENLNLSVVVSEEEKSHA